MKIGLAIFLMGLLLNTLAVVFLQPWEADLAADEGEGRFMRALLFAELVYLLTALAWGLNSMGGPRRPAAGAKSKQVLPGGLTPPLVRGLTIVMGVVIAGFTFSIFDSTLGEGKGIVMALLVASLMLSAGMGFYILIMKLRGIKPWPPLAP
jgi:hypothetical protein